MVNLEYTFKKIKIFTDSSITSENDVISKVYWQITFTDGISNSIAMGSNFLDTSNLENFIPIDQITDDVLEEWIINANGGSSFIISLELIHGPIIERKTRESKLTTYYEDSNFKTLFI